MKHHTYYKALLLFILTGLYNTPSTGREATRNLPAQSPLCFIENKGQITDQYGKTRKDIDFKLKANGLNVFIGAGAIHYQWYQLNNKEKRKNEKMGLPDEGKSPAGDISTCRMDVVLLGANKNAVPVENETNDYYENYYTEPIGLKGATAHSFKRITYKNVYPNIDWVLYISNGALKYDFVVHPGGDVKTIRLQYNGATSLELKNGALIAVTPMGSITEQAPYTYYAKTHKEIKSNFILNGNILSYNIIRPFDGEKEIIIDPTIGWATYFGGSNAELSTELNTDGTDIYTCGYTSSASNIATTGAYQTTLSTGVYQDAYLAKFTTAGTLIWSTYFGGNNEETGMSVASDAINQVYLAGYTASNSNIATAGAFQTSFAGPNNASAADDAFLAKFDMHGSLQWSTYYGGPGFESFELVRCDDSGNVFFVGNTFSDTSIATSGAYKTTNSGGWDVFVSKFSTNGARIWATYYGGTNHEFPLGIETDTGGNLIICGRTNSLNGIATSGAHQTVAGGDVDGFLAKFSKNGALTWGTYYGGAGTDDVYGVTRNIIGDIFIAGNTSSLSAIATTGSYQANSAGMQDGYIAKFNGTGVRQWCTYYGSAGIDEVHGIDVGANGLLYINGSTTGSSGISTYNAYDTSHAGTTSSFDAMLLEFTTAGSRQYATYYGGTGEDRGDNVVCLGNGVYFNGTTNSTSDISTTGAYQTALGGSNDAFLIKFILDTVANIRKPFSDTLLCGGSTFQLPYDVTYKFKSNNVFTAQLSNASGSFASPINIGSLNSDTAGVIICTIPSNTPTGTGYRVRITTSNPALISADNGKNIAIGNSLAKPVAYSNSPVCQGSNIQLFAVTTTVNAALKWIWSGPNNYASVLQNPVIINPTSANAGDYIVTAQLYGCIAKDTESVVTISLPAPLQIAGSSNSSVCTNDTLKLFSSNSSSGATYTWTGPNGFTANTQNALIIHPALPFTGDYIISATLNGCSVKDTVTVILLQAPSPISATSNSPLCNHDNFTMNAGSGISGTSYSWNGPFGYSSSNAFSTFSNVSFVNAGDYIVTATLNGCVEKDTVTLVVNPLPVKPIAASNTPICSTDTLRLLSATLTTGVGYSWTGPNGFTSPAQNPSVNNPPVAAAGDYIVTATITATGCAAKDTETVAITQSPSVTATNNSPVCEGSTVSLSAVASPATAVYSWSGPGSFSSPSQNPVISNAATTASGDYIVSATLNGCTGKDTTTVLVKPNPIIPVTNSNTPVCIGGVLNLTAASNAGSTYSWTGPNSFSSTLQNPSRTGVTAADAGTYAVIATLNGCVSPAGNTTVVVNPQPFVTIYATPADSICQGSTATFVALPANASASVAYKWTKNSSPAVLGTANTLITTALNNNDIVRCEITEAQKCGVPFTDTSNEVKMTVLPWVTPAVSISANPSAPLSPFQLVSFAAVPVNGGGSPQYQWTRNGSNVIGANAAGWSTQQLSNNDVICVSMTSSEKCPQPKTVQSNCIKVTVLTGVAEIANNAHLQLYPNPNDGRFIIHAEDIHATEVQLEVVNATGQLVYSQKAAIHNNTLHEPMNIQALATGVYLLKLEAGGKTYTQRFTVDR